MLFNISSNVMLCLCGVRSTCHAMLYTKQNLRMWGFTMPKGFRIGQHIREIIGTSKDPRTFGHTVLGGILNHSWREHAPKVVHEPKVEHKPLSNFVRQMDWLEFGASTTYGAIPVDLLIWMNHLVHSLPGSCSTFLVPAPKKIGTELKVVHVSSTKWCVVHGAWPKTMVQNSTLYAYPHSPSVSPAKAEGLIKKN